MEEILQLHFELHSEELCWCFLFFDSTDALFGLFVLFVLCTLACCGMVLDGLCASICNYSIRMIEFGGLNGEHKDVTGFGLNHTI